ncbi:hypothetical protein EKL98_06170 [Flavobacterium bomense]|uniref:Uncharacterized protein n=1 Tax=Flavobacterium bomense TaxID=2497483 RepID=A0A432CN70_9FLAO|nr:MULTISPECIES: hypothetical protein [Flavobacterium]RTY66262.1 hypothetical protein EKL95_11925 [Flavobacterium sp. LB2P53]RTZ05510.1 hypothetical protein EKL98_06170 [Flavobacterium bomense]
MSYKFLLSSLFFGFFLMSFLIVVLFFPNLQNMRSGFQFTAFDSVMFYDIASKLSINDLNSGFDLLAYKGYPIYLISYVKVLNFLNIDVNYQILLCSNLIIVALLVLLYSKMLTLDKKPLACIFILFALFEPSFFGFALTLERELFLTFFLGLICFSYLKLEGVYKYIFLLFSFFMLFNLRIEILFIVFLSVFIFNARKIFINQRTILKKYSLLIFGILFISLLFFYLYINYGTLYIDFMELQLDNSSKGGIGGKILAMPLPVRIIVYSILYFFLPFPTYTIFMQEMIFPYEIFISIAGVSYLFLWGYILKNIKYIKGNSILVFIICIVGHIVLGGTLFNYRHRIDLIAPLSILVLHIINFKIANFGFTVRFILKETFNLLGLALVSIILLNLILYIII